MNLSAENSQPAACNVERFTPENLEQIRAEYAEKAESMIKCVTGTYEMRKEEQFENFQRLPQNNNKSAKLRRVDCSTKRKKLRL